MDAGKDLTDDFYKNYYDSVFSVGSTLSNLSYRATHKALERGFRGQHFGNVLEIGAGKGEHFEFVKHTFDSYTMLDKVPNANFVDFKDSRVSWKTADIEDLASMKELHGTFDRIVMTCVLHHLDNPFGTLQLIRSLLKTGGVFSLFFPSDPGLLNRIIRRLFVTPKATKLGFSDYQLFNALEHKNHFWGLKIFLGRSFLNDKISVKYYPLNIPLGNMSLFSIWNITKVSENQ